MTELDVRPGLERITTRKTRIRANDLEAVADLLHLAPTVVSP
jgi:hypothetical protein